MVPVRGINLRCGEYTTPIGKTPSTLVGEYHAARPRSHGNPDSKANGQPPDQDPPRTTRTSPTPARDRPARAERSGPAARHPRPPSVPAADISQRMRGIDVDDPRQKGYSTRAITSSIELGSHRSRRPGERLLEVGAAPICWRRGVSVPREGAAGMDGHDGRTRRSDSD